MTKIQDKKQKNPLKQPRQTKSKVKITGIITKPRKTPQIYHLRFVGNRPPANAEVLQENIAK